MAIQSPSSSFSASLLGTVIAKTPSFKTAEVFFTSAVFGIVMLRLMNLRDLSRLWYTSFPFSSFFSSFFSSELSTEILSFPSLAFTCTSSLLTPGRSVLIMKDASSSTTSSGRDLISGVLPEATCHPIGVKSE
eukprot:CAMPEP_0182611016 /NCGR_PEP_ID=MMETSP1330-20130603/11851_1 /TAXON_ID=464278 /ORGANISM="Picochlorum sp., Strain RCC944" /LENGTH=132 /DNA_ID=CAMNT_0024830347 /DNA_START=79 /DNA_END=477 /DNA_ORIENTATION=-